MGFNRYPSLPTGTVSQTRKCQGCHSERSEESRPINRLHKSKSFGGVYPENIEGPQDDIATQPPIRGERSTGGAHSILTGSSTSERNL